MTNSKTVNDNFIFSVCAPRATIWGMIACILLPTSLSHRFCHKDDTKGWIFIKKTSVHGSSKLSCCAFDKAIFAARSASSFPLIYLWLGIKQNVIYLLPDNISWHVRKTLFTRGFLLSCFSMACNTGMLSENYQKTFPWRNFIIC